jgi:hypothetical protein
MEDYDFSQIPLWDSNNPNFEIFSDSVSGRVPVTRLEHWQELSSLLEAPFFNRPDKKLVFRGHRRYDWGLMPTLARIPSSGIITKELAQKQLDQFRRAVRGRLSDYTLVSGESDQDDELWAVGQHHGLQTPLLDWTYSPYVALFFAFSKSDSTEEKENPYRAIYVLNKTFVADDDRCPDIRMFEPKKDYHGRLVNQAGLFTFSPYDSTIENKLADTIGSDEFDDDELRNADESGQANLIAKYICKIYIRNEDRDGCIRHLRRMNVHHASLFPDLIGASDYCNLITAEEQKIFEDAEAKKREVAIPSANIEISVSTSANAVILNEVDDIAQILRNYSQGQVEPGRLRVLAEHIALSVPQLLVVDWTIRESIIAQIRSAIRINLRKYGYPVEPRDAVITDVIEYFKAKNGG